MEIIDLSIPRNREMVASWANNPAGRLIESAYSKAERRAAVAEYNRIVAAERAAAESATNPVPAGVIRARYSGRCASTGAAYSVGTLIHRTTRGWSIWSAGSAAPAAPAHRCWECGSPIASAGAVCTYCGESADSNWLLG